MTSRDPTDRVSGGGYELSSANHAPRPADSFPPEDGRVERLPATSSTDVVEGQVGKAVSLNARIVVKGRSSH